jgi:uncharacterized membrane protein YraQ (UPF0718 family)
MVHWFWLKLADVLLGGVYALADYLSLHVLLCLIPAFFIAGAMIVFIPQDLIIKYIGKDSKRIIAYPVAAIAGLLLAVCSCTVLPLFAGIKKKGAGLGPAITFLFSAPAVNILALTYTGALIGMDIAIARAILALAFAIIIGFLMEIIFKENPKRNKDNDVKIQKEEENTGVNVSEKADSFALNNLVKIALGLSIIVIGVLIAFMNRDILIGWGISKPAMIQTIIWGTGVVLLIVCLFVIENTRMNIFLILLYILFTGTSQITYFISEGSTETLSWMDPVVLSNMGIKTALTLVVTIIAIVYSLKKISKEDRKEWMIETWDFVKKIFPYIIIGVFIAGMLQVLIPPDFIQNLVGENTVVANSIGVAFGVIAYFPTLMEVPIAKMFLNLGMSRGVLLAYLLADPELSIQSILVTRKFLGDKKNLVYVLLVAVFTIIAGLLFGLIVSKEPIKFI